jgi:Kdo2-lipid IVA lauroyltransferase/acyltransferase
LKNDIIYFTALVLIKILNAMPRSLALMVAGFGGELWYLLGAKDRRMAQTQMMAALGISEATAKIYGRACFENMTKNLADALRMSRWSKNYIGNIVDVEGLEHFDKARAKGKGIAVLTGHIGNFELLAVWFAYYKEYPVSVVGRKLYDERFDQMLVSQRQKFNVNNIPNTESPLNVMRALNAGHALGFLLDQDSRKVSGRFADFFGRKAITAAGPVFIARKTGAPVVPMAIYRKADDRYVIRIMPELEFTWTDNKDEDIINALTLCNQALEKLILYDPIQWVWIHNRWRTRPPEEKEINK